MVLVIESYICHDTLSYRDVCESNTWSDQDFWSKSNLDSVDNNYIVSDANKNEKEKMSERVLLCFWRKKCPDS